MHGMQKVSHTMYLGLFFDRHAACPMVDSLNGDLTTYCSELKTTGSLWYVALNSLTLELLGFIKTPMSLHAS